MQASEESHPSAAAIADADLRARALQPAAVPLTATTAPGASSPSLSLAVAAAALRRPALLMMDRVCALMGTGPAGYSVGSNSSSNGGNSCGGRNPVSAGPSTGEEEGADSALPQLLAYSSLSSRFPVDLLPEAHSFFLQHCCQQKSSASL